ncbi:g6361 [Coccomyxa elongata]
MTDPPPTRKPYRITKQREKWSDSEHQRFTEAVEKYGRDWKAIVEHVGTRSVAQVRSHAQKFFLKLEKSGQADVVPPPRPKKRAAKPYPVQDRSEERHKSKRSRTSNSNSSAHSQPSHTRGALTPSSSPSNGRSSHRSAATAATAPGSSSRPLRSTRVTRGLAQALKGSSQDLEGNGSNIASAHESNNEYSEGPSANQENSGLSTGCADLGLQLSSAAKLSPPTALPSPEVKTEPANYGKLYSIVNGLFDSRGGSNDESSHKQMMEQLEPGQRKELLAMMDQLTGNLRNTEKLEALKAELKAKSQSPQPQLPETPPVLAEAPAPKNLNLDHAASMPLMPSTACLPMPQNVSEEPLALMQPLPGSQGTALLQPMQQCSFAGALPPPMSDACELMPRGMAGSVTGSVDPSVDAVDALLVEPEQSIADQLLGDGAAGQGGPGLGQGMFDMQHSNELEGASLQLPKQSCLEQGNSPLDTCLAQLESGTSPTVPESEDFLDSWKIGSSDPVWQTLDMQQPAAPASPSSFTRDTNGSMFVF